MNKYLASFLSLIALAGLWSFAQSQAVLPPDTTINCAYNTSTPVLTAGQMGRVQCDAAGNLIVGSSALPSGAATAANQALEIAALNSIIANAIPSCTAAPVVSGSAEATHVLKASAGTLCSVYATNLTSTPGYLVVTNTTSAPGDGAITPLDCAYLPAFGNVSINGGFGSGTSYGTGITAVVTSAATCFTKTTGVITAFIKGQIL